MYHFKKNIQLLEQEVISEFNVITSKEGLPIFEVKGFLTNSKYNPISEAKRYCDSYFKKNYYHILLGIGSGVIAKEISFKLGVNEKMLIIEPNEKLFNELNNLTNLSLLLDNEKVEIITGLRFDDFEKYLGNAAINYNNRIQVIISPNYEKIYPLFVKQSLQITKEILMMQVVNRNTLHRFYSDWQENFIKNIYYGYSSIPFSNLVGKMNIPVVVVSGGPSLNKQLKLVEENRKKLFLICAGSTINTLLSKGIRPDVIVSIDGGYENYKHFKDLGDLGIPMFYHPMIHKDILKIYKGQKVVFNDEAKIHISNLVNNIFGQELGEVRGGPSVANYCLDIAIQLTSGPICLIGQDLAYTNNETHAKGNKRFSPLDKNEIEARKMFYIEGYNGESVLTDYPFFSMKKHFEGYIKSIQDRDKNRMFNCTEGGAMIEGFTNIQFQEFINSYCKLDVNDCFEKILNKYKISRTNEQWKSLYNYFTKEKNKSKKVKILCEKSLNLLHMLDGDIPEFNIISKEQLDKIDIHLKELLENEFLFYLFGEVTFNIDNNFLEKEFETELEKQKRIYNKSLALYEGLFNSSNIAIEWFDELLEKISSEYIME